jgi:hypothetical protein
MSGRACREKEPEGKDEDPKAWYSSMNHFWLFGSLPAQTLPLDFYHLILPFKVNLPLLNFWTHLPICRIFDLIHF